MWAISFSLIMFSGVFTSCSNTDDPETPPTTGEKSPYITRVLDFRPAVGQFVNQLPEYKEGDTQEDMNRKVLEAIGNNKMGMVSLGGFGGYIVVGFDHTIENKSGLCDFRVLGNAFYANGASDYGSSEPGVIQDAMMQTETDFPTTDGTKLPEVLTLTEKKPGLIWQLRQETIPRRYWIMK